PLEPHPQARKAQAQPPPQPQTHPQEVPVLEDLPRERVLVGGAEVTRAQRLGKPVAEKGCLSPISSRLAPWRRRASQALVPSARSRIADRPAIAPPGPWRRSPGSRSRSSVPGSPGATTGTCFSLRSLAATSPG